MAPLGVPWRGAVVLCLFVILPGVRLLLRCRGLRFLLRPGWLVPAVLVPAVTVALGTAAPVIPALTGILPALGGAGSLLPLWSRGTGGLWLRVFICHNNQTDKSGQKQEIVWHERGTGLIPGNTRGAGAG